MAKVCALVLLGLVLLTGCGRKGPLYQPERAETTPSTSVTDTASAAKQ